MSTILFIAFIVAGMVGAFAAKKLTLPASVMGGLVGTLLYFGMGWIGVVLVGSFFLLGTLVTSWKKQTKAALHIAQENEGRRNIGQVIANGGVGGLLGLMGVAMPGQTPLFIFLVACAFSSATADTVSSELGSVYGKRFYDVITFKRGKRGNDGIVSFEGLFFGMVGSALIAFLYAISQGWNAGKYSEFKKAKRRS